MRYEEPRRGRRDGALFLTSQSQSEASAERSLGAKRSALTPALGRTAGSPSCVGPPARIGLLLLSLWRIDDREHAALGIGDYGDLAGRCVEGLNLHLATKFLDLRRRSIGVLDAEVDHPM